jgi:hypothetical protein
MGGAEQAGPDDDSAGDGAARSWSSSETVTRRGVKQKMEAEPSSMVAEFTISSQEDENRLWVYRSFTKWMPSPKEYRIGVASASRIDWFGPPVAEK